MMKKRNYKTESEKTNIQTHDVGYLSAKESCGHGKMFCLEAQAPESSQKFSEGLSISFVHAVYKPGLVELARVEVAVSPILGLYCTRWPACDAHFAVCMKHWLPITEGELLKAPKALSGCVLF